MKLEGFTEVGDILRGGVYALCAKGVVIYVGKSKSMIARINAHRRAWIDRRKKESWLTEKLGIPGLRFDEIHILPCPAHLIDQVEAEMINKYKPHYNVQLKNSQKVSAPINLVVKGVALSLNAGPKVVVERRI